MPSIDHLAERHTVVDARPGLYLSFPDIALAGDGPHAPLVLVYRESDGHYPSFQKLLVRTSADRGATWSGARVLNPQGAHCPRISRLWSGTRRERLAIIDDGFPKSVYFSHDQGRCWAQTRANGMRHVIPDRIMALDDTTLFTTAHFPRGDAPHPATGQPVCEQMCFISNDMGATWQMRSVLANDPRRVFCEASVTRLPDGRLLALLRENTGVFEPCYACASHDNGATWSEPAPTPLIGHRPCAGVLADGRVLVTYRDVSPDPGTAAWLGSADELLHGDFAVHTGMGPGCRAETRGEALCLTRPEGQRILFALRPLTDPVTARASLEVVARVQPNPAAATGADAGLNLHLGTWFEIGPDWIKPAIKGARRLSLPAERANRIRLEYEAGVVTLRVNGKKRKAYTVSTNSRSRCILVGMSPEPAGTAYCSLYGISLYIPEQHHQPTYTWEWTARDAVPGTHAAQKRLMLKCGNGAWGGDFGYSGWVQLSDNTVICAYHHADATISHYVPAKMSHIIASRLTIHDFVL